MVLGGAFVVVAIVALVWPREREPEYQGQKLSLWIGSYKPPTNLPGFRKNPRAADGILVLDLNGHSREQVTDAIRHMGTNGMAKLVDWVSYEPPRWRVWLRSHLVKLPGTSGERARKWLTSRGDMRALAAETTLGRFRSAELPMNDLERVRDDPKRQYSATRVRRLLNGLELREQSASKIVASAANEPSPLTPSFYRLQVVP